MAQGFWDIRVAPLEKPVARPVGVIPTLSTSLLYSGSNITDSFIPSVSLPDTPTDSSPLQITSFEDSELSSLPVVTGSPSDTVTFVVPADSTLVERSGLTVLGLPKGRSRGSARSAVSTWKLTLVASDEVAGELHSSTSR